MGILNSKKILSPLIKISEKKSFPEVEVLEIIRKYMTLKEFMELK